MFEIEAKNITSINYHSLLAMRYSAIEMTSNCDVEIYIKITINTTTTLLF